MKAILSIKHRGIEMKNLSQRKRRNHNYIRLICWIILPVAIITVLILDALKLYTFNTERLIVMGVCILVVLIPFFKEITVKNISIVKENDVE